MVRGEDTSEPRDPNREGARAVARLGSGSSKAEVQRASMHTPPITKKVQQEVEGVL